VLVNMHGGTTIKTQYKCLRIFQCNFDLVRRGAVRLLASVPEDCNYGAEYI
jgi:hypothetical protein